MAVRYKVCTSTAQALELLEAGLLWKNVDMSDDRSEEEWVVAQESMVYFLHVIDTPPVYRNTSAYLPEDFAYAVED